MSTNYLALDGTTKAALNIGGPLSAAVQLKLNSGALEITNYNGSSDVGLISSTQKLSATTNQLVLGSTLTHPITINTGTPTATYTLTLPTTAGTSGFVLQTDGTGVLTWVAPATSAPALKNFTTTVTYTSSFPVTIDTLPANAQVDHVTTYNTTAWTSTSDTISVGATGSLSEFAGATDIPLSVQARFDVPSFVAASSSTLSVIVSGPSTPVSTAGSTVVEVWYFTPTP
jgi:hypothetical protein